MCMQQLVLDTYSFEMLQTDMSRYIQNVIKDKMTEMHLIGRYR